MIKVTVMVWFELQNGEPRFKDWEEFMLPEEVQATAKELASMHRNGSCKIFDNRGELVIGSAGF